MTAHRTPAFPRSFAAQNRSTRRTTAARSRRRPTLEALEGRTLLTGGLTEFSGPFSVPVALVNGPDGNLWVLNQGVKGQSSLVVIAPDHAIRATYDVPTPNAEATALTVGPDGNLWFVEQNANKIGKVTPSGTFTEYAIPESTTDPGFGTGSVRVAAMPTDLVAGPDGALWFTESSAQKIGRITTDGRITEIAVPGRQPTSIAVGPDNLIWFTDTTSANAIGRVNADGSVSAFPLPSQFAWPTGLTAGPDGALWFVESLNHSVGRITTDGVVTETAIHASMNSPQRLAFDAGGNLWVTGSDAGLVRIGTDGVTTAFGPAPSAIGSLGDVTIGADGAVWFTDTGRDQIGRLDPSALADPVIAHTLTATAAVDAAALSPGRLTVSGAVATFQDANPAGLPADFSVWVHWGDGTSSTGSVRATGVGSFVVTGDHTYFQAGTYSISVSITDTNPSHTPRPNVVSASTSLTLAAPPSKPSVPARPVPGGIVAGSAGAPTPASPMPVVNLNAYLALFRANLFRQVAAHRPWFVAPRAWQPVVPRAPLPWRVTPPVANPVPVFQPVRISPLLPFQGWRSWFGR